MLDNYIGFFWIDVFVLGDPWCIKLHDGHRFLKCELWSSDTKKMAKISARRMFDTNMSMTVFSLFFFNFYWSMRLGYEIDTMNSVSSLSLKLVKGRQFYRVQASFDRISDTFLLTLVGKNVIFCNISIGEMILFWYGQEKESYITRDFCYDFFCDYHPLMSLCFIEKLSMSLYRYIVHLYKICLFNLW